MKTTEELKALREEWEHESLPPPNSNRLKAEVLAIIDTALAAIAERDAWRDALWLHTRDDDERSPSELVPRDIDIQMHATLVTARSLAMKEAARVAVEWMGEDSATAQEIRALAPLPSGLVAVRKEAIDALEAVAENASANPYAYDHERGYRCCRGCGRAERKETHAADCEWLKARAALALLKEPR